MAQRPPRLSAVNMATLSVNNDAGTPTSVAAASKVATTSAALVVREAREATSSREWSNGAPHRFVGRGFLAAFAGLVYAFAEVVADEEAAPEGRGQLLLVMPFHHGFVTAVVLVDACRSSRGSEADVAVGH